MTSLITICDTCKREGWDAESATQTDGQSFATLIETAAENESDVRTRRHSCLMGCQDGCNVAVQSHGKLTYVLGKFEPSAEAAHGLVNWAALHAQSQTGQVPYKQWPAAVKGHFVARIPLCDDDT